MGSGAARLSEDVQVDRDCCSVRVCAFGVGMSGEMGAWW